MIAMGRLLKGVAAFVGTWVAMMAVGEMVLQLSAFGYVAGYGVISFLIAERVERWILTEAHNED